MDYQDFIATLPSNQIHRFDNIADFLDVYSHRYPTDDEREQIYRLEDWIASNRHPSTDTHK